MKPKKAFAVSFLVPISLAGAVALKAFIGSTRTLQADLHQRIDHRAELNLFENFQNGLHAWESAHQPIGRKWSYDPSGLVVPGELSFFAPSMRLVDYDVETWAEIVNRGFGLVFRAARPRSYYALKLMTRGSGASASLTGEWYTVIDGKTYPRQLIHGSIPVWKDERCHIRLQARGDSFALYVQGQLIDHWSDSRLASGGVGMFCDPGERARIIWVRVSNHRDLAGKLCAWVSRFETAGAE
jgi:hypothetical protein